MNDKEKQVEDLEISQYVAENLEVPKLNTEEVENLEIEKQVSKIVFYGFNDQYARKGEVVQQVCIFFDDGTVLNTSVDEGLDYVNDFYAEKSGVPLKEALNDCIEDGFVEMTTGDKFEQNFSTYIKEAVEEGELNRSADKDKNKQLPAVIEEETKKEGFFTRLKKSIMKHKKLAAIITTITLAAGIVAALVLPGMKLNKDAPTGTMKNGITTVDENEKNNLVEDTTDYKKLSMEELIVKETNKTTKDFQSGVWQNLNSYNDTLSNKHIEEGKTSRLAKGYMESAVQYIAYNKDNLTQVDINGVFGDYALNSNDMKKAYNEVNYQEMQAYVVSKEPVDKSGLFKTQAGKDFNAKYATLISNIVKTDNNSEKQQAAESFYSALREDFKTNENTDMSKLESYKASITPIVAAAEMMCQNYDVDFTLNDDEIAFFNMDDKGLCNKVNESIDDAANKLTAYQIASNALDEVKQGPSFDDFKEVAESNLKERGLYNLDDRDITDHNEFQRQVNWKIEKENNATYLGASQAAGQTTSTQTSWTETDTSTVSREEAVATESEEEIARKEQEANAAKFAAANEEAKRKAEAEAEAARKEQQAVEDEKKAELDKEVAESDKDYQENIDDANKDLENGGSVNEDDLGHGTDFDNSQSDSNGNLNGNIGDITTDGTDAVDPNAPLPNPDNLADDNNQAEGLPPIIEEEVDYEKAAEELVNEMANTQTETVENTASMSR